MEEWTSVLCYIFAMWKPTAKFVRFISVGDLIVEVVVDDAGGK